jgi:hypothetical protein
MAQPCTREARTLNLLKRESPRRGSGKPSYTRAAAASESGLFVAGGGAGKKAKRQFREGTAAFVYTRFDEQKS